MERSFPGRRTYRLAALAVLSAAMPCLADGPGGVELLKAEVSAEHTLFTPGQPLRLRFTLINPTDEVIEIPNVLVDCQAIALPLSVVYGEPGTPALFESQDGAKPDPLTPEKPMAPGAGDHPLRLAARGSVGTELDFRPLHRELRYGGLHRIEWKPLGGKIGTAAFEFRIEPRMVATLLTDYGKINFTLLYDKAPRNVENFLEIARNRWYDGSQIHRILPSIGVIQGGKPSGGRGEKRLDGKTVPAEFHDAPFDVGTLAMALAVLPSEEFDPNSASCQFVIGLSRTPKLDGALTVIGQASDEESRRTLQMLSEQPTDGNGRPLRTVKITSFLLIPVEIPRTERLELGGR